MKIRRAPSRAEEHTGDNEYPKAAELTVNRSKVSREDRGLAFIVRLGLKRSLCIILLCFNSAYATTWQTNGTAPNVQYTHDNLAHDGDTITLPAGTFTWSSPLRVTKAITIMGAGIGNTIVRDSNTTGTFIKFVLVPGKPSRLSGIEFVGAGNSGQFGSVTGQDQRNGQTFRLDHCKVTGLAGQGYIIFDTVLGVADHNTIVSGSGEFFRMYASYWNGATSLWGDASRAAPINWGSNQFFFIEDNNITQTGLPSMTDGYAGARFVVRHNTITNGQIQIHGTDSSGRDRGAQAIEIYNNNFIFTLNNGGTAFGAGRGGCWLIHDNTFTGWGTSTPTFALSNLRMVWPFWPTLVNPSGSNGHNPWDINKSGGPFYQGTAATASTTNGAFFTVKASGAPNWATNQWYSYTIERTSNLGGSTSLATFSEIQSNTSNTITYKPAFSSNLTFAVGDTFRLWKVSKSWDMACVSEGPLLTSANPPIFPAEGNTQKITPSYSWNNVKTNDGVHVNIGQVSNVYVQGIHYFRDTAAPGYVPFQYPHPLVSGAPQPTPTVTPTATPTATPRAPTNLTASAVSSSRINLSWTDNSNNETGFVINRTQDPSKLWNYVTTVGANVTSYANTGLHASTTYFYRVQATNAAGRSAWSNTASAKTQ